MCKSAQFQLEEDTQAVVFSYNQIREMIWVKKGQLLATNIQYTEWGETVVSFEGYPALITKTHWGPTPFMKALKDVVR